MFNKLSAKGGGNALLVWTRIWSFFLVFLFVLKLHDLILKEILATVFFKFIFREREGREKERERNISVWLTFKWPPLGTWPATQACALTGN